MTKTKTAHSFNLLTNIYLLRHLHSRISWMSPVILELINDMQCHQIANTTSSF
ncbi:unnamed protein product, partial [Allacma fusca]